jgi:hypothetical protein
MDGSWHILNRFCPDFSPFSAMIGSFGTIADIGGAGGVAGAVRLHSNIWFY